MHTLKVSFEQNITVIVVVGVFKNNNNNNNNNNAIRRIKGRRKYTLTKGPFASACILTIRVDKTDFFYVRNC